MDPALIEARTYSNRLERALRAVLSVPAVRMVLGTDHIEGCRCPVCRAEEVLKGPPLSGEKNQ